MNYKRLAARAAELAALAIVACFFLLYVAQQLDGRRAAFDSASRFVPQETVADMRGGVQ